MKNFDFIKKLAEIIPDFAQRHEYCDKAEIFQSTFPEESASNARKALEWLVKNHLSMANVTLDPYETLSQMIKRPQIDAFINDDWNFEQHMRTVKKIGNYASHIGSQPVRKNDAFVCLRALYYVVSGFLFRWQAIKEITAFDATLVPTGFSGMHVADQSEPTVSLQVVDSVPAEAIEHPKIEAKSTMQSADKGRKQAMEYADGLEKKHGVRPVIYYTNGYETKVIDGLGYRDREVISFHSEDDLERMIQKRGRADITDLTIDDEITNRPYQKTAIKSLVEWLNKKHRRGLLVLATGTGKTRVSISLCKLLSNNNWIKKVLFLADRTELVNQAHGKFEEFLPSESMSCLSEDTDPDLDARFIFSTYQTMINYINAVPVKFSVGHFDLIIIDEAHRSVFGKYGAIFQYFDSLLIGLTATPRAEIDKNTFKLLELENAPNYEYTYDEAIGDRYLCPYRLKNCTSKMINRGIKYDELSKEERDELEKVWEYEKALKGIPNNQEYHRDIQGNELFRYLINDDTIDNVLSELMTNGLKINCGEDVGKTIIFAYNHKHAERIVERFRALYPERGADYCQLIDNQVKHHSAIIADFRVAEKMPQIAVSVDMLDTGIDVPEILNLVFFKIVKSKIKFDQMIGRGTRMCQDIFGPNQNKKEFYIFDWCGNFTYFSKNGDDIAPTNIKTLTQRLFELRVDIAKELQSAEHQEKPFDKQLHDDLKTLLHKQVASIGKERKETRPFLGIIEPFREKDKWTYISEVGALQLKKISHLVPVEKDEEETKRFDVVMLHIMLAHINTTVSVGQFRQVVVNVAAILEKKATVPAVMAHINTIRMVQTPQFWENESLDALESVHRELREIVHLLKEQRQNKKFVIDIEDEYTISKAPVNVVIQTTYKQRVIDYLAENSNNETLRKIQNFEQLTAADIQELERIFFEELGTKDEYNALTEGHPYKNNVAAFIRVINGIDHKKALQIYQQFVDGYNLTSEQEQYLKNILDYVSMNGDIETKNFMEYPLKQYNWRAIFGDHFVNLKDFIKQIHGVISA